MTINAWLALRDDAQSAIVTRLTWDEETQGEYSGPITDRQAKVFALMHDRGVVQKLFRTDRAAGRDWTLWSVYFDLPGSVLEKVRAELDRLAADYPTQFVIVGVWRWDGSRIADYPLHPRILKLMPDETDENGDVTGPATQVSDINLALGQAPRQFT